MVAQGHTKVRKKWRDWKMNKSIKLIQQMIIDAVWKALDLVESRAIREGRRWGE